MPEFRNSAVSDNINIPLGVIRSTPKIRSEKIKNVIDLVPPINGRINNLSEEVFQNKLKIKKLEEQLCLLKMTPNDEETQLVHHLFSTSDIKQPGLEFVCSPVPNLTEKEAQDWVKIGTPGLVSFKRNEPSSKHFTIQEGNIISREDSKSNPSLLKFPSDVPINRTDELIKLPSSDDLLKHNENTREN
jgi:hypothetical protein